ncbi:hypothetical protein SDC9_186870 [bioreactor metagenome]|uniref:Uncharacterized protein n=1 Tax=bioreactor metagenome TaxID=1076179 RepID=A0A645HLM6_9ZZZZ
MWNHTQQAARRAVIVDHVAAEHRQTPRIGTGQTGQTGNQCGFAGAIGTEQAEELALFDRQADAVQGRQGAKALDHSIDGNGNGHGTTR